MSRSHQSEWKGKKERETSSVVVIAISPFALKTAFYGKSRSHENYGQGVQRASGSLERDRGNPIGYCEKNFSLNNRKRRKTYNFLGEASTKATITHPRLLWKRRGKKIIWPYCRYFVFVRASFFTSRLRGITFFSVHYFFLFHH